MKSFEFDLGFYIYLLAESIIRRKKYLPSFIARSVRKTRKQILSSTNRANEVNKEFIARL